MLDILYLVNIMNNKLDIRHAKSSKILNYNKTKWAVASINKILKTFFLLQDFKKIPMFIYSETKLAQLQQCEL